MHLRAAVVASLLLTACGSSPSPVAPTPDPPPVTHLLDGYVRAGATQTPLTTASVTVTSLGGVLQTTAQHEGGYFWVGAVREGVVTLHVECAGYQSVTFSGSVTRDTTWVVQLPRVGP